MPADDLGVLNHVAFCCPDLIFATGDVAYSGKAEEYAIASSFFDKLLEAAGLDKSRLFVVPGNHDVHRGCGTYLARTLASQGESDAYFGPNVPKNHLTQKMAAFLEWHDAYFRTVREPLPRDSTSGPVRLEIMVASRLASCLSTARSSVRTTTITPSCGSAGAVSTRRWINSSVRA